MITELHSTRPSLDWTGHWLSPTEYARIIERPVQTVRWWCITGRFEDFSIPHFIDRSGRHWIKLTPGLSRP